MALDGVRSLFFSGESIGGAKRFAYIDALRGYAVLGVLLTHSAQGVGLGGGLPSVGARGVQLFFVVSATTLMLSWHERDDSAGPFFLRRAFRILPMFWLSIPLYFSASDDLHQVIGAAFLLQGIRPEWIFGPIVPGGWSVCAEAVFYCLFPAIVANITSLSRALWLFVASLVISGLWRSVGLKALPGIFPDATPGQLWEFVYFTFPAQLPAFAAGITGYFLLPRFSRLSRGTLELIILGAFAGMAWFAVYKQENIAAFAALFSIVAACMANGAGAYLVNKLIGHVGRCSFSIYLLQWKGIELVLPLAGFCLPAFRPAAVFIGAVLLSTAFATVTYFLVERPMIRLGSRLLRLEFLQASQMTRTM
jgi:peptidoglycan/LPS O-acetylase OafA/YrhL